MATEKKGKEDGEKSPFGVHLFTIGGSAYWEWTLNRVSE
jgi:hypothetical protein